MRAECVGDSQVACTFNFLEDYYYGSGCGWRSTSREQACHESDQPICPFPPPPILVKHETLPLNTGDKLCDPPKPFEDRIAWCYDHMAPSTYNDFVTACLSQTTPDTTQEVTCCVPNGGGGAGGQGATSGVGGGSSQGAGGSADTGGGYGAAGASGGYETNASSSSGFGAGFVEVMSL
jgi:hypothetical protein